jgi:pimeloyl-ACP methyl ester carboxylesterase
MITWLTMACDFWYFIDGLLSFLDSENISAVNLLGVSGGAPYALAAAAQWGLRARRLAVVCGLNIMTPDKDRHFTEFQNHGLRLARFFPAWQLEILINFLLSKHSPVDKIDSFIERLDLSDQINLKRPQVKRILMQSLEIVRHHGPAGIIFDGKNYAADWSVNLNDIQAQTFIFHGDQDRILNYRMAEDLARHIPNSFLKIYHGDSHYSLPVSRINEMLAVIFKASRKRPAGEPSTSV